MEETSKEHARYVLEQAGFVVEDVPVATEQRQLRADLIARHEGETYVIEAKEKQPTDFFRELSSTALREGSADGSRRIAAWSALSSVLEEAESQVLATPAEPGAIRLAWFSCLHADDSFIFNALRHRLYGVASVSVWRPPGPKLEGARECLYYDRADFFRRRALEGVIIAGTRGAQLLVNDFAERVDTLRTSTLYRVMAQSRAVYDPSTLTADDAVLAIRADIDRDDERARWEYLRTHYGVLTSRMTSFELNVHWTQRQGEAPSRAR